MSSQTLRSAVAIQVRCEISGCIVHVCGLQVGE